MQEPDKKVEMIEEEQSLRDYEEISRNSVSSSIQYNFVPIKKQPDEKRKYTNDPPKEGDQTLEPADESEVEVPGKVVNTD